MVTHYPHLGDFVEFYFSANDVLTYVPDSADVDPRFKGTWEKGMWIKERWNLRRLDKPIDMGG